MTSVPNDEELSLKPAHEREAPNQEPTRITLKVVFSRLWREIGALLPRPSSWRFLPSVLRRALAGFRLSSLTQRIVFINLIVLIALMAGVFSVSGSSETLIDAHQRALETQARNIASTLAETAIVEKDGRTRLDRELVVPIMRRLIDPEKTHASLFDERNRLLADSNLINDIIIQRELAPLGDADGPWSPLTRVYEMFTEYLTRNTYYPDSFVSDDSDDSRAYLDAVRFGESVYRVRRDESGTLIVSYAVPVQPLEKVLGILLLEVSDVDEAIRAERNNLLRIFALAIFASLVGSFWLAQTISKPVHKLADAADTVRRGASERKEIPNLSYRRDDIGDLSQSLRAMTNALYDRIDAIESFAADVAHEIKNPLTSLRSAVETFELAKTDEIRERLLKVIKHDVDRIDRLISDISNASRLDAELSRRVTEPLNVGDLLTTITDIYIATSRDDAATIRLVLGGKHKEGRLMVAGLEGSLGQVFRNLIDNASSFSPPGSEIRVHAFQKNRKRRPYVMVTVEDRGPGIPEENLHDIFNRFYTSRPESAGFGNHSGLGLSISQQIVEAHGGDIWAENVHVGDNPDAEVLGARFTVALPALTRERS